MNDMTNDLHEAMAEVDTVGPLASRTAKAAPLAAMDTERLIQTCDKLLRVQQARAIDAWTDYQKRKLDRVNYYRGEMQRLSDEAEHELLLMEQEFAATRAKIEAMIGKLKAMRRA